MAANSMTCVGVYFKCQQYVVKVWESAAPRSTSEVIKARVQVLDCINMTPKSEKDLGFLKWEMLKWLGLQFSFLFAATLPTSTSMCALCS